MTYVPDKSRYDTMQYRRCGRSGLLLPAISLGLWHNFGAVDSFENAQAMLRRQQAGAIVAARSRIVDGAVGMVEQALQRLSERHVVDLDEERKATMVSNLLVVLCGDRDAQPVVNTGTLYQ